MRYICLAVSLGLANVCYGANGGYGEYYKKRNNDFYSSYYDLTGNFVTKQVAYRQDKVVYSTILTAHDRGDLVKGGDENEKIIGNIGEDKIIGKGGDDYLNGHGKKDHLDGGAGNDKLYGEVGDDKLLGGAGDDYLDGGQDDDYLEGGAGNDRLFGNIGSDSLSGGAGADFLIPGPGHDIMSGGAGYDMFIFNKISESVETRPNEILDFVVGEDVIDLLALNFQYSDLDIYTRGNYTFIGHRYSNFLLKLQGKIKLSRADFNL